MVAAQNKMNGSVREVLDDLPVAFVETDRQGVILYASRAARDLYAAETQLAGKFVWELMPSEERDEHRANFEEVMNGKISTQVMRRAIYTPLGFRTYEIHRSILRDDEGQPAGVRSILFDVSEAMMAHEEAHQARVWMESVLASVAEPILVTDSLGFVRSLNRAAEQLFGFSACELAGQILEKKIPLLCYESKNGTRLSFQMALHAPAHGIATVLNRNREPLHVEVTASPVIDNEKGFTIGVVSLWRLVDKPSGCQENEPSTPETP